MAVSDDIRTIIASVIEGFDAASLGMNSPFTEAGLDSLDLATVLLEVQEKFGVEVPSDEEDQYDTLAKLTAFVEANQNA